jgi:hypothetical protein
MRERTKTATRPAVGVSALDALESCTPEQEKLAQQLMSEGNLVRQIAEIFNVHAATIYGDSDVAA